MSVTLLVSKFPKSNDVKLQSLNILLMSVTLFVLKWLRFRELKPLQPLNMPDISVTLLVSKLLKSKSVNPMHTPNIKLMFVTLLVLKELKLMDGINQHSPKNISDMSVAKLVSKQLKSNGVFKFWHA